MKKYRLAILVSHPIPYLVPLFRRLAESPDLDVMVYYCWNSGAGKEVYDPGFGMKIKWDTPLLTGYSYKFLRNISPQKTSTKAWGEINPGIVKELLFGHYDALMVHGYMFVTDWLAFFTAWITRTPILLRGESHMLRPRPLWRKIFKKLVFKLLFKGISCFLTVGTLNREFYEYYGANPKKFFKVPYAVDERFMSAEAQKKNEYREELKKELGIDAETVVISYVGKIFGGKGPGAFDLLKSFEIMENRDKAALVFVGDGREKKILEEYVEKNAIPGVIFAGFKNQTELPKYYSATDILVAPSYTDQWGLGINEAMYFGTAIVSSDQVGAARDLVREGKNGNLFSPGDVAKLKKILENLVRNKNLRVSMQQESQKIIKEWSLDAGVRGIISAVHYVKPREHGSCSCADD
ncbi:MAG: glycosyltransferase family 4 protein [Candidatus Jorgensenbacteria bacterium]|nr:glycosyltransferase family 4 protein [Candidatus Jorgensenbacteria bacterium]